MQKKRLDQLLVDRGLAPSRNRAQALILAGEVIVDEQRGDKPGTQVSVDAVLRLRQLRPQYASRAAVKLLAALDHFALDAGGRICLDAGASSGGFVEVLLERGAARVYAVDVGYGQLAYRLQQDPRVAVRDRLNVRHLTRAHIPEPIELMTLDLSFISLRKVIPALLPLAAPAAIWVCLVKPQFEVGRERVGKGGIVRDEAARLEAVREVAEAASFVGLGEVGSIPSPLPGQKGNQEYLLVLRSR